MILLLISLLPFTASDRVEIINEGGKRIVKLIGSVTFKRPDLVITCDQATIFGEDLAILRGNVVLKESTTTIIADSLRFKVKSGEGLFFNSELSESSLVITACSLRYDPRMRRIEGFDSVVIQDSTNDLLLNSQSFTYNLNSGIGESSGEPQLKILRSDQEPITTEARKIQYFRNVDRLNFIDSVRIKDQDLLIVCDSLSFSNKTSKGKIYNLNIRSDIDNITGDSGSFTVSEKEIRSMSVVNARVKRVAEDREDELISEVLHIKFDSGSISEAEATGNPRGKTLWK